ncbi:alpha/beta hydrolase [Gimesia sp.]|uniref:alpha/beta hydrolase n=1 Tax=Gimesia sp. TaxID=2024833 RepID=UPI000C576E8B|nr:alpha/beta hydrolase [Gimesia sp.]MAX39502.1 lipase [Gimesia sp.]HAH49233.1 lipase [Planctomycetaceae bacterium]HBL46250.1 lipase [Planctomycetaceae bacterium]|tara:strand:+ start:6871 stop:7734 length:864 start_codon:yes stop_codon:yes gene_type:complete
MRKQEIPFTLMILTLILTAVQVAHAEETEVQYKTRNDISYYTTEQTQQNEYKQERCKLDLYYPTNIKGFPTVVWFHGGGLKGGSKSIPKELQDQGLAIVAVNYRLYPKARKPAYLEDAAAAVAWTFQHIKEYGGNPELIFVAGHSAGGYLTSMLGLDQRWLAAHEIEANDIAGLIPYSGHCITHMTVREEMGIELTQPVIDDMAPLFHVRKDAPPILLITGDRELEFPTRYEENAYLHSLLQVVKHPQAQLFELDGFTHGSMVKPGHFLLLEEVKRIVKAKKQTASR